MDCLEAAAICACICFQSAGGKLIIVKRLWDVVIRALYKCTTLLFTLNQSNSLITFDTQLKTTLFEILLLWKLILTEKIMQLIGRFQTVIFKLRYTIQNLESQIIQESWQPWIIKGTAWKLLL